MREVTELFVAGVFARSTVKQGQKATFFAISEHHYL